MRIAKQTPTTLVVKSNEKRMMFAAGVAILILGLLIIAGVRVRPLNPEALSLPSLFRQQQAGNPSLEGEVEGTTTAAASYRLANYLGRQLFTAERPWVALALAAVIVGIIIVVGPYRGTIVLFDKTQQQVQIKEPRWFFRSRVETHPFETISEVRVERDRARGKPDKNYGANLIISHSDGLPLSEDYIHYKTVFQLSESFQYDYQSVQAMVARIQSFMAGE